MNVLNDGKQMNVQNVQLHKRANSQRGFTLIEILVVISIVAILASLAAPSFSQEMAKQRIRDTAANWKAVLASAKAENAIRRESMTVSVINEGIGSEQKSFITLTIVPSGSGSCTGGACQLMKYQLNTNTNVTVDGVDVRTTSPNITIDKKEYTAADIVVCDSSGIVAEGRKVSINSVGNVNLSKTTC